jgi:hypothetical protein
VNTILQVEEVEPGNYEIKAVQGQVVTQHSFVIDSDVLAQIDRSDIDGAAIVREAFTIVLEREALAALPGESSFRLLVAHYPYLTSELQRRLSPGSPLGFLSGESARIDHLPAEDRPTHT